PRAYRARRALRRGAARSCRQLAAPRRAGGARRSRVELAEILRPEVLEVFLELLRAQSRAFTGALRRREGLRVRLISVFLGPHEERVGREDGRVETQRDRDRVGRPGIDPRDRSTALEMQLAEVGVVFDVRDLDAPQRGAKADDEILAEVMRHRPLALDLL